MARSDFIRFLSVSGAVLALGACTSALSANPSRISLQTDAPGYAYYYGGHEAVTVRIENPQPGSPADVLAEPPARVTYGGGTTCEIGGGNWKRDSFWSYDAGRALAVAEFSGSNDWLTFYDSRTCAKLGDIDVSGRRWRFEDGAVVLCEDLPDGKDRCFTHSRLPLPEGD